MDKRAQAVHLLAELGQTLNIDNLTLEESDTTCVLFFGDDVVLNNEFDEDSGCMVLSSYPSELPTQNAEPMLRELLAANLDGTGVLVAAGSEGGSANSVMVG